MRLFDKVAGKYCPKCTFLICEGDKHVFVVGEPDKIVWTCRGCGVEIESHTKDYEPTSEGE